MIVSSYISPKAAKGGHSAIGGRGLVAVAPIGTDEIVAIKGGHIVDTATLRSLPLFSALEKRPGSGRWAHTS